MTPFFIFTTALLLLALVVCIQTILTLREIAEERLKDIKHHQQQSRHWYEEAATYKAMWLASLLDDGDGGIEPDDAAGLEVPEEVRAMARRK